MKPLTCLATAVCLVAFCATTAHAWITEDGEKLVVSKLSTAPEVDGKVDDVWDASKWIQLSDQETRNPPTDDVTNHSARMKVGYFGSSIFILVDVTDQQNDVSAYQPFFCDSVEVFIDLMDKRETIAPEKWAAQGGPAQFRAKWYDDKANADMHFSAESPVAVAETEAAYAVANPVEGKVVYELELKVAQDVLAQGRERVAQGTDSFGLIVAVNDGDDGDRVTQYFWAGGKQLEPGKYNAPLKWRGPVTPWQRSDWPADLNGDGGSIYAEAGFRPAAPKRPQAEGSAADE